MWTGQHNIELGGMIIGVGYQDEETQKELGARFGPGPSDAPPQVSPPAFGITRVRVGLTRRPLYVVQYGLSVRHRARHAREAVDFLSSLVVSLDAEASFEGLLMPFRVVVRGEEAVLVEVPFGFDLDERPLWRHDVAQVPLWRATVDPSGPIVRDGDVERRVTGIVVATSDDPPRRTRAELYNHVFSAASAPTTEWAWAIDDLGARVVESADPTREILRLLSGPVESEVGAAKD